MATTCLIPTTVLTIPARLLFHPPVNGGARVTDTPPDPHEVGPSSLAAPVLKRVDTNPQNLCQLGRSQQDPAHDPAPSTLPASPAARRWRYRPSPPTGSWSWPRPRDTAAGTAPGRARTSQTRDTTNARSGNRIRDTEAGAAPRSAGHSTAHTPASRSPRSPRDGYTTTRGTNAPHRTHLGREREPDNTGADGGADDGGGGAEDDDTGTDALADTGTEVSLDTTPPTGAPAPVARTFWRVVVLPGFFFRLSVGRVPTYVMVAPLSSTVQAETASA